MKMPDLGLDKRRGQWWLMYREAWGCSCRDGDADKTIGACAKGSIMDWFVMLGFGD